MLISEIREFALGVVLFCLVFSVISYVMRFFIGTVYAIAAACAALIILAYTVWIEREAVT